MSLWELMVSIFWFMLLVAWFWLLVTIVTDVFRDNQLSGVAKAGWCLFVLLLPWVGVLTYLLVRGRSMNERAMDEAARNERAFRQYVRQTAESGQPSIADELGRLADLHDRGKISAADYEQAKSQVLAGAVPSQPAAPTDRPRAADITS
jgi:hypothetical protein